MKTADQPPLPVSAALEVLRKRSELKEGKPTPWEEVASTTFHSKHTVLDVWRWFKGLSWEEAKSLAGGSEQILRLRPDYLTEKVEEAQKAHLGQQVSSKTQGPVVVDEDKPQHQPSGATDGATLVPASIVPQTILIPMRGAVAGLSSYSVEYGRALEAREVVSLTIRWNRPWGWGWRLEVYDPLGNLAGSWQGKDAWLPFTFVASLDGEYHLRVTNLGDVYTATGTMEITPPGWRQTMG